MTKVEIILKEDGRKIDNLKGRGFEELIDILVEKFNVNIKRKK